MPIFNRYNVLRTALIGATGALALAPAALVLFLPVYAPRKTSDATSLASKAGITPPCVRTQFRPHPRACPLSKTLSP